MVVNAFMFGQPRTPNVAPAGLEAPAAPNAASPAHPTGQQQQEQPAARPAGGPAAPASAAGGGVGGLLAGLGITGGSGGGKGPADEHAAVTEQLAEHLYELHDARNKMREELLAAKRKMAHLGASPPSLHHMDSSHIVLRLRVPLRNACRVAARCFGAGPQVCPAPALWLQSCAANGATPAASAASSLCTREAPLPLHALRAAPCIYNTKPY